MTNLTETELRAIVQRAVDEERRTIVDELYATADETKKIDGRKAQDMARAYRLASDILRRRIGQPVEIPDE